MAEFKSFLPHLLKFEGGFVNHPSDPGGATNKGITLNTYRQFFGSHKTVTDLKNIPNHEVETIYKAGYWQKIKGDNIDGQAVASTIFDMAVNAGPQKAAYIAQYVLHNDFKLPITIDGVIGPKTTEAINSVDDAAFFNGFQRIRRKYYYYRAGELSLPDLDYPFIKFLTTPKKSQKVFLRGWLNRVEKLEKLFPIKKKK